MHDYDNFRYIGTQKTINLSKKENILLQILIKNKGNLVTTDKLLRKLYPETLSIAALIQLVHRLRTKLKGEVTIITRHKIGYRIEN